MSAFHPAIFLGLWLAGYALADRAAAAEPAAARVDVLYFHRTLRCLTCRNMEAYTAEGVARFPVEGDTGRLAFRAVNLDDKGDRHFEHDYALEFSSVVLSRRVNGQEVAWTNLPAVWELVGDKQNFAAYVEREIARQLGALPKE